MRPSQALTAAPLYLGAPVSAVEAHPSPRLRMLAELCGLFAILVGTCALLGWWAGVGRLTYVLNGWPRMMPNTAVLNVLSGGALLALSQPRAPVRKLGIATALLVTLMAGLTLSEWLLRWNSSIDRLFLPATAITGPLAGRSSPQTALTFVLIGPALALLDRSPRRGPRVSELLVLLAMSVPILALLGYAYGVSRLYGLPVQLPHSGMAVHTAVTLLVLGLGIFVARPASGLMGVLRSTHAGGAAARRTLIALLALPLASFLVILGVRHGLYPEEVGTALVVFVALLDGLLLLLATSSHLERKDAALHRALAETEHWKRFFEHADWGAAISVDGRFRFMNDAFRRMHGVTGDELIDRPVFDVVSPDLRSDVAAKLPLLEQRGTLRYESENLRKDGSRFPALIDLTAIKDESGRVLCRAAYVRDVSEEKKAELDRARLASLIESSDEGVIAASLDGLIVHWNPAAERIYGYKADEIVGRPIALTVPACRVDELRDSLATIARGEPYQALETVRQRKDGSTFDAALTISPIISSGKVIGASAMVRDISERKAAEQALAQAHEVERKLRTEIEEVTRASVAISDAVAELPKSNLSSVLETLASQAATLVKADYVALGIGTDERKPFDTWVSLGVPDEQARAIGRIPRPIGVLGAVSRREAPVRARDVRDHPAFTGFPLGHPPMAAFLAVPIRYHNRWVGNLYLARRPDTVEFSEHDERLVSLLAARAGVAIETATGYVGEALQRAWLQAMVDQMPEPVIVLDGDGHVALQNRPAQALAQTPAGLDFMGRPLSHDIRYPSGEPVPAAELPHYRALQSGESVLGAEFVIAKGERRVPVVASATPVRIETQVVGAVALFQDVSALKELERQRQEWISIVAHDLRQPISTISLATEAFVQRTPGLPSRDRESLNRVQKSVDKLGRMINDLLDASRLEAHRLTIEREPVNLRALLEEIVSSVPELAANRVQLSLPDDASWISADRVRIEQVFRNLLSNAGKYGAPGTPVEIAVVPRQGWFEVTVRNRGAGIEREDMAHLFQRFSRSEASKRAGISGIGLGLYITRGLVEAHGGQVWAESTPGESTAFHVTLPRTERYVPAAFN
jgi:PAS domain S-box-containing protein